MSTRTRSRQSHNTTSPTLPFGKFRGYTVTEVPTHYLWWLVGLPDLRPWLRKAVDQELNARGQGPPHSSHSYSSPPPPRMRLRPPCATPATVLALIEAGRRSLAKQHHPDLGGEGSDGQKMTEVNAAADWLSALVEEVLT